MAICMALGSAGMREFRVVVGGGICISFPHLCDSIVLFCGLIVFAFGCWFGGFGEG